MYVYLYNIRIYNKRIVRVLRRFAKLMYFILLIIFQLLSKLKRKLKMFYGYLIKSK